MGDDSYDAAAVRRNLTAIMFDAGTTQGQFAERIGMTQPMVSYWRNGRQQISEKAVLAICHEFGVTPSDVLSADGYAARTLGDSRPPDAVPARGGGRAVPVRTLGTTHAGEAVEASEDPDAVAYAPEDVVGRHPSAFFLRVDGDCMDRRYPPGCLVLVDPRMDPWSGCAVVAEVSPGETVLREYLRGSSTLVLSPDSHSEGHEDMVFRGDAPDVRLVGVVVWFQADHDEVGP